MKAIQIENEHTLIICETLAKRIKTTKDLNNFFAWVEQDLTSKEWEMICYDFGKETPRIECLMSELNYVAGEYDYKVIKKLWKGLE